MDHFFKITVATLVRGQGLQRSEVRGQRGQGLQRSDVRGQRGQGLQRSEVRGVRVYRGQRSEVRGVRVYSHVMRKKKHFRIQHHFFNFCLRSKKICRCHILADAYVFKSLLLLCTSRQE